MVDKAPGIDIQQRHAGETILIETDTGICELEIVDPAKLLVLVSGTYPWLRSSVLGQLEYSTDTQTGEQEYAGWIRPLRTLTLRFRNATFETGVVMAATIRGDGWSFDVF